MVCRPARRNGRAQRWARVTAEPRAPLAGSSEGRIDEQDVPLAGRGAVAVEHLDRPSDERLGELAGVPDRRRAADDDRVAAVVGADPEQPPQHVGDVPAEHAPIGVELVDDDVAELLEEQEPLGVMGQDRGIEHVRVGRDDLPRAPDRRPDRCRRVAVVGRRRDLQPGGARKLRELRDLVLAERLRREEEQGARRRVLRDGLQDRQRVAQRLARCRRRDDDHVPAGRGSPRSPPPGGCTVARSRASPARPRSAGPASRGSRQRQRRVAAARRGGPRRAPSTARQGVPSRTAVVSVGA